MNKKLITSIFAVAAIAATNANAAVTKETCNKSDKYIWVEEVKNINGDWGACVPKDACNKPEYKREFCNQVFANIQVNNYKQAVELAKSYLNHHYTVVYCTPSDVSCEYVHTEDLNLTYIDINNRWGQDYIGLSFKGNYIVFEFDDTNETFASTGKDGFAEGKCLAVDGTYIGKSSKPEYEYACTTPTSKECGEITGYKSLYSQGICHYTVEIL